MAAAPDPPDSEMEDQDQSEILDETHLNEDQDEFATFEDVPDVMDVTQALGDARDEEDLDEADFDPEAFDDEDLETDEDIDDSPRDDLEDEDEGDNLENELPDPDDEDAVAALERDEVEVRDVPDVDPVTNPRDDEPDKYESNRQLSDKDLEELGYKDRPRPAEVKSGVSRHQDQLLDEAVEETFPASDPIAPKRVE